MSRKTILAIDTDGFLCMAVGYIFARTGANIALVHDEIEAMREIYLQRPDLVMIDIDMSDGSAVSTLRNLRRNTTVPIIVTTSTNCQSNLTCFNAGADACLAKPCHLDDLLARVKAMLRNTDIQIMQQQTAVYDDGYLMIDPVAYQITAGGKSVKLTPLEFRLLVYLVNNAHHSCTFSQILKNVWGDESQNNKEYVHTFIWQLRQKLERDPKKSEYIQSVHGVGYRFQAHQYGEIERMVNE